MNPESALGAMTALHWACSEGRSDMMEFLLKRGACIDCHDVFNQTPLQLAAKCGQTQIVENLISKVCIRYYNAYMNVHVLNHCSCFFCYNVFISA